jgi:uncharacterized protein YlaI
MARKYSDGYLLTLWRTAVYHEWGRICAICHRREPLEAHHIVPRAHRLLRYARINGIPLCPECHRVAKKEVGRQKIAALLGSTDWKILEIVEQMNLKDFLKDECMTREEYYESCADSLKRFINGEYVSSNLWEI